MYLQDAAELSSILRECYYEGLRKPSKKASMFWQMTNAMIKYLEQYPEEIDILIDLLYPKYSRYNEYFITISHIRQNVCNELGISPIVWDEALLGQPIVPTLAEESPVEGGAYMKGKEAIMLMHDITDKSTLKIATKMNEEEAKLFWSRALGESPCVPIHKFLQIASNALGNGKSMKYIRRLLDHMTPTEIIVFFKGSDPQMDKLEKKMSHLQPGSSFSPPLYPAWTKTVIPSGVYLDVVKGQRRYLHIVEFPKGEYKGTLYTRDRKAVANIATEHLPIEGNEAILEVEVTGNNIDRITDVLALGDDWEIYKQSYVERLSLVNRYEFKKPVTEPHILEEGSEVSEIFNKIEDGERVRLISSGPFEVGGEGGWILLQKAFHLHLLLSRVKRNQDYDVIVGLSVMDGFDPFPICEMKLGEKGAYTLRERLATEGVQIGTQWMPIDEYAIVFVTEVHSVDEHRLGLEEVELLHIDSNLGLSDVSQLTDVIELGL